MANPEHLAKLKKGVEAWNQWREKNSNIEPNLKFANLVGFNLVGANLYRSNLEKANLFGADVFGSNLYGAKLKNANLYSAKLLGANLENAKLNGANLVFANLESAYLLNADLGGANLFRSNLFNAYLIGAKLRDTYLQGVQALATNFEGAALTGACIKDWNINNQTSLKDVKCDYIYLKGCYSEEEEKWIFAERVPHDPDKIFAPGEFTKRYQKILETVNLYFEDGIDWQAFLVSFNKLQIECESNELSINSFENKGSGAFVIKVNVPEGADKAEIEKYLKKQYQLEATVEAQQRELSNLYKITELLAGKPININTGDRTIKLVEGNYNENIEGNYAE